MEFRARPIIVGTAIVLVALGLSALGVWQLYRNEWKQDLVHARNERIEAPPQSVGEIVALPLDDLDYRRVEAHGTWDNARTMVLANRARFGQKGEEAVTPLVLEDGTAVLVNRGWYPEELRDEALANLEAERTGTVDGLVRYLGDAAHGSQTPAGTWTMLDTEAMGADLPYEVRPWYVLQGTLVDYLDASDRSLPSQQYTPFRNTVPHVEYALTWFGLAAALVAVSVIRFIVTPRRERARQAAEAETLGFAATHHR